MPEVCAVCHIKIESYGFISLEYSGLEGNEDVWKQKIVDDYHLIQGLWNKGKRSSSEEPTRGKPTVLGERYTDQFGHVYKAETRADTKELGWVVDKV